MNTATLPRLQVVILAAGYSTRLGAPKALARVHGRSLLRRMLSVLAVLAPVDILVVLPPRAARQRREARGFNVRFAVNTQRAAGMSSSVRLALRKSKAYAAALLLPVDLARLRRADMTRLVSRWRAHPRLIVARCIGGGAGTPLILPRRLFDAAAPLTGDSGLRQLLGTVPRSDQLLCGVPSAALDVDTADDLRAVRARFNLESAETRPARAIRARDRRG